MNHILLLSSITVDVSSVRDRYKYVFFINIDIKRWVRCSPAVNAFIFLGLYQMNDTVASVRRSGSVWDNLLARKATSIWSIRY